MKKTKVVCTIGPASEQKDCLEKLIGKKINIYALDRVESTNLVTQYRNLEEVKRLPKTRDLNINDIEFE